MTVLELDRWADDGGANGHLLASERGAKAARALYERSGMTYGQWLATFGEAVHAEHPDLAPALAFGFGSEDFTGQQIIAAATWAGKYARCQDSSREEYRRLAVRSAALVGPNIERWAREVLRDAYRFHHA